MVANAKIIDISRKNNGIVFSHHEAVRLRDRAMKLTTVRKVVIALFAAAVVLTLILGGTKGVALIVLSGLVLVLVFAACVISFRFSRCPYCKERLLLFGHWEYCPRCGKKLEEQ